MFTLACLVDPHVPSLLLLMCSVGNKKERAPSASRVLSNGRNTPLDFSAFQYSPPHPPASSVNPKKTSLQLLPVPSPGEPSPLPPALPSTARPTPPSAESTSSESVFVIGSSDDAEASEADRKLVKRAAPKRATDMSEGEGRSKKLILAAGSSEDEPEAEDVETASEDDGGDGSEEEEASLDELLAALLSRVEPLSHRIRSALESWAAGGSCSVHRITADEVAAISPPGKTLKAYQLAGLNWAWLMRNVKCNGVLADEMGLGKTVQAAILLGWLSRHCGVDGPHLVVAPASTLANWQRELTLWCPKLRIVVYSGTAEER